MTVGKTAMSQKSMSITSTYVSSMSQTSMTYASISYWSSVCNGYWGMSEGHWGSMGNSDWGVMDWSSMDGWADSLNNGVESIDIIGGVFYYTNGTVWFSY